MSEPSAPAAPVPYAPALDLREPLTVDTWVRRNAGSRPDAVALIQPGSPRRALTWSELDRRVGAVAAGLAHLGLVAGHRLALCGENSIELVTAYLAALRAGFVAVPLDPHQHEEELRDRLEATGARILLTDQAFDLPGGRSVALTEPGLDELAAADGFAVVSPADPEGLAALVYTAGTSAEPRAAMISQRALVGQLTQLAQLGVLDADTVTAAVLPMSGVFGLVSVLGSWTVSSGALVVVPRGADLESVVRDEQITNLPLTPLMIFRLLRKKNLRESMGTVRTVVTGGAPLPAGLAEQFEAQTGRRVDEGYGLTEAPAVSTTLGGVLLGQGHVGRVLPGMEVRIGDGVEAGEPGEIFVRGDSLFSGYWPDGRDAADEHGWFATGDIGYLNAGELFWVDRIKDLITVSGFPVYPAEIERVIGEQPGVDGVAVIARRRADGSQQIVAFVSGDEPDEQLIMAQCRTRLARFKQPTQIVVLSQLPRGVTGMVQKAALRRRLALAGDG